MMALRRAIGDHRRTVSLPTGKNARWPLCSPQPLPQTAPRKCAASSGR